MYTECGGTIFKSASEFWPKYRFEFPRTFILEEACEYIQQTQIDFIELPKNFCGKLTARKFDKIVQKRILDKELKECF